MSLLERFKLSGKTALVTGAGQGLGRAFALALAEAGADVAVCDIRGDSAERTAADIRALGRRALAQPADTSNPAQSAALVDAILAAWSRLDIAVNNVGIANPIQPALEITEAVWDRVMNTNLRGTFFCCQAEARAMRPRRSGSIINLASICGKIVWPEPQSVYSISKAGVAHLTRCLAAEWIRDGIRVNCISPGVTKTPELFPAVIPVFLKTAPIDRVAEVGDLVGAVLYLASDLSDFMVGHELVLDGGYTLM